MTTYDFISSVLVNGVIFSVLAVISERVLIKFGVVRGDTFGLIIGAFLLSVVKQLIDSNNSIWIYCLFVMIVAPLTVNRTDVIATMNKGRWWWKIENENKSH